MKILREYLCAYLPRFFVFCLIFLKFIADTQKDGTKIAYIRYVILKIKLMLIVNFNKEGNNMEKAIENRTVKYRPGDPLGTHRVLSPKGVLPQPAEILDNDMKIYDNEVLINVHTLNIDSASFTEIERRADHDVEKIKEIIMCIVEKTGKHKNPWTGSGGMLIGTVAEIGPNYKGELKVGDKIATLVSLSLTPLKIEKILDVRPDIDQVDIEGQAILFESGIFSILPDDLPQNLALSVLDVAGAPAQTAKICHPGDTVVILGGGGKSGMLCCYMAKKEAGVNGQVICIDGFEPSIDRAKSVEVADHYIVGNATDAVGLHQKVAEITNGRMADVVINVVNIPNTEMASIMLCRDGGMVYFFSMASDFTKAALGAEGVGKDINMLVGNGYTKGHANVALQVLRENDKIRNLFNKLYA